MFGGQRWGEIYKGNEAVMACVIRGICTILRNKATNIENVADEFRIELSKIIPLSIFVSKRRKIILNKV